MKKYKNVTVRTRKETKSHQESAKTAEIQSFSSYVNTWLASYKVANAQKNSPAAHKAFSPISPHYKRDICQTVDRTPQTANKVSYDSYYYDFLIHGILVKLSYS